MKHAGKARKAAFKIILFSFIAGAILWGLLMLGALLATASVPILLIILPFLLGIWVLFSVFTLYFFRDPNPKTVPSLNAVLSPAYGKVDVIDRTVEPLFMKGECQRVSVFLSVLDVHVQNAPISGKVVFYKYTTGEFMNAIKTECADCNENALLGFDCTDPAGKKIALRLIAGVIARRIVPYVKEGEEIVKGQRISLVQFGSRGDIYLPLDAKINVKLGDHVVGGETILARFD